MAQGDNFEQNLDKALNDLRLYDLAIDLHGSRALGISGPTSNADVLITRPLQGLLNELMQDNPWEKARFSHVATVPCDAPWYQPAKMLLCHVSTGVQLDLISRWSADIFVRERDAVAKVCIAKDERVAPYLNKVLQWLRKRQDKMPADEGYPGTYMFRIMALHFLMYRMVGVVLPPLTKFGAFLNNDEERFVSAKKDKGSTPDDLYMDFLEYLGKAGHPDKGLHCDLRDPMAESPAGVWQVVDTPSHKSMLSDQRLLDRTQIMVISRMAKNDAQHMKADKDALDSRCPSKV